MPHQSNHPLRVVAFSLWGDNPYYKERAEQTIRQACTHYPGWEIRIYIGDDILEDFQRKLIEAGAVIYHAPRWCKKAGYFWRFLPAGEPEVDAFISRDLDSDITPREVAAVRMWLHSGMPFHIIRDHPKHTSKILGGMWGCRKGILYDIVALLKRWNLHNQYGNDEAFLAKMVYPRVSSVAMVHSDVVMYTQEHCLPIPHVRQIDGDFIGKAIKNPEYIERQKNEVRAWQKAGSQLIRKSNLRIAVLFYGLVHRSLDHTISSIQRFLFEPLQSMGSVDLFYHTWDSTTTQNPRAGEHHCQLDITSIERHFPEALGCIDNEDDFVSLIDWEHVYCHNPYRTDAPDNFAEQKTIRNVVLALHSLEMAYDVMLNQCQSYDFVVATRADLQFLKPLRLPVDLTSWEICLPDFHGWGGHNDRFACGGMEAMEVYCRRSAFFDGSMLHPNKQNPEWVLAQWLNRNRLRVSLLDFPFQRVHANGDIFVMDRQLVSE